MEILEKIRGIVSGDNGGAPPSLEDIKQARQGVREELREVEARLEEMEETRTDLLIDGTEDDLEAHDREVERLEREAERLEAAAERLAERQREAELVAWREEVREIVAGLPGLTDRHRQARDQLSAVEAEIRRKVKALQAQSYQLSRRGSPVYLEDAELERLQAVVDQVPGLHADLSNHLKAPPSKEGRRHMVETQAADGSPALVLVGDWPQEDVKRVAARHPDHTVTIQGAS